MAKSGRGPFLSLVLLLVLFVGASLWFVQKRFRDKSPPTEVPQQTIPASPAVKRSPTAFPFPSPEPTAQPSPQVSATGAIASPGPSIEAPSPLPSQLDQSYVGKLNLIIPVLGIKSDQLRDTFAEARSEGRVHDAIDIPAPQGTPVIAAADGEIARLFQSDRGGTTIYELSMDKKLVYYYAHLQRYADGLSAGKFVRQGDLIAYVGDTGNAGAGNYHLHFSIAIIADPKRYWEGTNINPYPLLHR